MDHSTRYHNYRKIDLVVCNEYIKLNFNLLKIG